MGTAVSCFEEDEHGGRRRAGHVAHMGDEKCIHLVRNRKGKLSGRPRHRWKDNFKIYLKIECMDLNWIQSAQDKIRWRVVVNLVVKLWVPSLGDRQTVSQV